MKKIIAFETSCDDTAVAIVTEDGQILGEAIYSQLEVHRPYGGVVPELGSRAHIEQIGWVTEEVFRRARLETNDIDVAAATFAPGLVGPLLVGAQYAKGFAKSLSIPLIAVHHIEGHILSGFGERDFCEPPFVALIVSGGHTALYECDTEYSMKLLGQTLDDAAGEAFDKLGRALGLQYPAGKMIDDLAQSGRPDRFHFPKVMRHSDCLNFSFSGLKTFGLDILKNHAPLNDEAIADFCAGLREAIAESLCQRALRALTRTGHKALVVGGGVTANSRLRMMLLSMCREHHINIYLPEPRLCTDNAVMIARAALVKLRQGKTSDFSVDVAAHLPIERSDALYAPIKPRRETVANQITIF